MQIRREQREGNLQIPPMRTRCRVAKTRLQMRCKKHAESLSARRQSPKKIRTAFNDHVCINRAYNYGNANALSRVSDANRALRVTANLLWLI
jgi:hypothetical protein